MTEREYIEAVQKAALAYIDALRGIDARKEHVERWVNIKEGISPITMVKMCEMALEAMDKRDAAQVHRTG